jgi:peptide/nickel transport system permease protein
MRPSTRGSALKNSSALEAPLTSTPRLARATWRLASVRPLLQPKILIGGAIVFVLVIAGVLAPWIAPYDPNAQNLAMVLKPPQWFFGPHALGTDAVGRDILSRLFYGARVSLVIAVMVVLISGVVGIGLGALSGYFAGALDFAIQKLVEVVWAFPPLLLAIAIMAFLGQGLDNLILALVIQRWISYCRVARGQALSMRSREFVEAARALGASDVRIIMRHIVPNLFQSAIVIGTFAMASAIISEASLSFLGLGVPPEIPTWGSMLADGRTYISTSWWLALFPGLCIFFTVLGINLLGDGLRDLLDPRLKRSRTGIG